MEAASPGSVVAQMPLYWIFTHQRPAIRLEQHRLPRMCVRRSSVSCPVSAQNLNASNWKVFVSRATPHTLMRGTDQFGVLLTQFVLVEKYSHERGLFG